jgi:hypothetical protein
MQFVIGQLELLRRFGAKLGPYVLLELLLPGGTLFALLLFLYQRWKLNAGSLATLIRLASPPALVSTLGRGIPAMQPCHAFATHGSCLRVCYGESGRHPSRAGSHRACRRWIAVERCANTLAGPGSCWCDCQDALYPGPLSVLVDALNANLVLMALSPALAQLLRVARTDGLHSAPFDEVQYAGAAEHYLNAEKSIRS